jgi:hypothetical protein
MLQPSFRRSSSASPVGRAAHDRLAALIGFVRGAATDSRVVLLKVAVVPFEALSQVLLEPLVALGNHGADVTVVVRGSARGSGLWPETARTLEDHGVRVLLADGRRRRLDAVLVRRSREGLEAVALDVPEPSVATIGAQRDGLPRSVDMSTLASRRRLGGRTGRRPKAGMQLGRRLRWFNELTLGSRPVHHDRPPIVPGDTAEWVRPRERAS